MTKHEWIAIVTLCLSIFLFLFACLFALKETLSLSTMALYFLSQVVALLIFILSWIPEEILFHGLSRYEVDPSVKSYISKLLHLHLRPVPRLRVSIIEDPCANAFIIHTWRGMHIYFTEGLLKQTEQKGIEGILVYLTQYPRQKYFVVSTMLITLASLFERVMITGFVGGGLIHALALLPEDTHWDKESIASVGSAHQYQKVLTQMSEQPAVSTRILSSANYLGFTNSARGIHTHEGMFAAHYSEKERLQSLQQ